MFMLSFAQNWSSFVQADLWEILTDKIGDVAFSELKSSSVKSLNWKKASTNAKKRGNFIGLLLQ
jgi:hypothetical protein